MAKLGKEKREKAITLLLKEYQGAKCALNYDSNFHLLVAVVLSAQTTDIAVNKVTPALFDAAPDAFSMAQMKQEKLEEYIHQIGLYKNKAKNVIALSKELVLRFDGEVPNSFDDLTSLPGVGRKTANVVLAECFHIPSIAVDTHVFRLSNRIGLVDEKDVLGTEEALKRVTQKDQWISMHHALIWHGRRVCMAKNPKCEQCCLSGICKKNGI